MLHEFLHTGRGIAFTQMFAMTEYPPDIMPLYAQGYSLAEFLIQTGGRRKYIEFLGAGLETDNWSEAVQRHYGINDLNALQNTWLAWVRQGSPMLKKSETDLSNSKEMLAANQRRPRPEPNLIYHIPSKELPAAPVPASSPRAWTNDDWESSESDSALALNVPRGNSKELPATGWHASGSPTVSRNSTQVAHPQPMEYPRQTILR